MTTNHFNFGGDINIYFLSLGKLKNVHLLELNGIFNFTIFWGEARSSKSIKSFPIYVISSYSFMNTPILAMGVIDFHKLIATVFRCSFSKLARRVAVLRSCIILKRIVFLEIWNRVSIKMNCIILSATDITY